VDVPLVIDTTEIGVMEVALKTAPGRCLINSTHLESGRDKADLVFTLAKQYNAAVLCLTIDEQGMAQTAQRKLEVAKRLYDIAVIGHGLRPEDLVFDTLTFTLATGDNEYRDSAIETIKAIKMIKSELPGVFTSLGVSNVSFGLAGHARPVLNSIMLFHAVEAGLDMAIVNPAHIKPYAEIPEKERSLTEDLLLDRRPDALQFFIEYFESVVEDQTTIGDRVIDPIADYSPEQRLHWRILHRQKEGVQADIDEILARKSPLSRHEVAVEILNTVLLPAMKEVGDKFGAGELILPFVLQSAEVMKTAVAHVEQFLDRATGTTKGTIVLATVYGDVHDIGKNLVKTILSNNGYTVVDLGKQVPAETIISKAQQINANAIGLSALLVSTSKQMPLIVNELQRRGLDIPVLVGGAAINRRFGWRMLYTEAGEIFQPGVFYCKDAFEGLAVMDQLNNPETRDELLVQLQHSAQQEQDRPGRVLQKETGQRSKVRPHPIHLPMGVSWGSRVVRQMPLELVFKHLSKKELFRLSWGAKNTHGEEWEQLQREFEARLVRMQREALRDTWLMPQGIYGYWPVQAQGDEVIVYDPTTIESQPQELSRLSFPRQPGGEHLCIADYFAGPESGVMDVLPLQVVTVGAQATAYFDQLQMDDDYAEGYFVHGLAVQTAEAAAVYLHHHILRELGLADGQGKRYSWGYPAVPQLEDHRVVFDLLPAESELGMSLTEAYQLVPEQSTAALIVHHPQAKYFSVGASRVEQLSG
jgi:5-methyltetrahydrofolate--homocysteine methyltransferase